MPPPHASVTCAHVSLQAAVADEQNRAQIAWVQLQRPAVIVWAKNNREKAPQPISFRVQFAHGGDTVRAVIDKRTSMNFLFKKSDEQIAAMLTERVDIGRVVESCDTAGLEHGSVSSRVKRIVQKEKALRLAINCAVQAAMQAARPPRPLRPSDLDRPPPTGTKL